MYAIHTWLRQLVWHVSLYGTQAPVVTELVDTVAVALGQLTEADKLARFLLVDTRDWVITSFLQPK